MEKRLIFTATSPASGDSTTWFDVTSNKKLTLEELVNAGKIIRPAYKYVGHHRPYVDMDER